MVGWYPGNRRGARSKNPITPTLAVRSRCVGRSRRSSRGGISCLLAPPDWLIPVDAVIDALVGDARDTALAALKALVLFVTAVVLFRISERHTLAELAPFDFVTAVAVGAIVGRTATAADTSFLTGAAALVTLLVAHGIVSRLRFLPGMIRLVDPPGPHPHPGRSGAARQPKTVWPH